MTRISVIVMVTIVVVIVVVAIVVSVVGVYFRIIVDLSLALTLEHPQVHTHSPGNQESSSS